MTSTKKGKAKPKRRRKLFVWDFGPDHYPGLIVAMAYTENEARKAVLGAESLNVVRIAVEAKPRVFDQTIAFINWGGG